MNFLNFIKTKEINFIWEYQFSKLNQKNKINSFEKSKKSNIIKILKIVNIIKSLISKNSKVTVIISKGDISLFLDNFLALLKLKNISIITNWKFGQLTNKASTFLSNKKFCSNIHNQIFIFINPGRNVSILQELNKTLQPSFGIGQISGGTNKPTWSVNANLTTTLSILSIFYLINKNMTKLN